MKLFNAIPSKVIKNLNDNKYYVYVRLSNVLNHDINLYFLATDKLNNDNDINYFILDLYSKDNEDDLKEYMLNNEYNIILGIDFFVDNTFDIENIEINNDNIIDEYIIDNVVINDNYEIINDNIRLIKYIAYQNSKEEIDMETIYNFNQSFMNIILDNTNFSLDSFDALNTLYKYVMKYYANGGVDDATVLMNSIFNTTLPSTVTNGSCGCSQQSSCVSNASASINTGTQTINIDEATCLDKYKAAMYQWLIKMLSDVEYYCCWMIDENELEEAEPNYVLIDKLIALLTGLLNSDIDLSRIGKTTSICGCHSFGNKKTNKWDYVNNLQYGPGNGNSTNGNNGNNGNNTNNSNCSDLEYNSGIAGCTNYSIISNYIKVLNWVKNNEIDENKNKIYIYGKQFAEIFPLLNF